MSDHKSYQLTHLEQLEAEAIYVMREVAAQFERPSSRKELGHLSSRPVTCPIVICTSRPSIFYRFLLRLMEKYTNPTSDHWSSKPTWEMAEHHAE